MNTKTKALIISLIINLIGYIILATIDLKLVIAIFLVQLGNNIQLKINIDEELDK